MLQRLTPLLFLLFALSAKGIDTLTVREVYSYNVGDTLDFKNEGYSSINRPGYQYETYSRKVITGKTFSTTDDTLFISFNNSPFPNLILTQLDSCVTSTVINSNIPCPPIYGFDTTAYPGLISNTIGVSCGEVGTTDEFTQGLGRTYHRFGGGSVLDGFMRYSEKLIYYSNGVNHIGTPMEDVDGSKNVHYIPLPEECAVWTSETRVLEGTPDPEKKPKLIFTEQIRTGAKHAANGYNYVELIYTCIFANNPRSIKDSLIGYFFNDTIRKEAVFTEEIGPYAQGATIYDGTLLPGESCDGGMIYVDSVLLANQYRTRWDCSGYIFNTYYPQNKTIVAGIGHLWGLIKVQRYNVWDYFSQTVYEADANLTCFSVCGQILLPTNTTGTACALLTDVPQIEAENSSIKLYPIINNGQFVLEWMDIHSYDQLQIFDLSGRLVQQFEINNPLTTCRMNQLNKGMYLWQAISKGTLVKEGKMVVE